MIKLKVPRIYEERRAEAQRIFHYKLDLPKIQDIWSLLFKGGMEKQCSAEVGLYRVRGTGTFRVDFLESYRAPAVLKTSLGWWDVLGIKIPVPLFIYSVDSTGMNLLHLIGESFFFFMVFGV